MKSFRVKYKEEIQSYALLAFPIIWTAVFYVVPLVMAFFFSFTNLALMWNRINRFGFFQYRNVLTDDVFWRSLGVTGIWTAVMVVGNIFFGLMLALLISRMRRGAKFFLALLIWPMLVSAVANARITETMFGAYGNSPMNILAKFFGAKEPVVWLMQESTALISLMMWPFFFGFCFSLITFYTSLLAIPQSYKEACKLETNSFWAQIRLILIPLIRNTFVLNLLLATISGMRVLGPMQLITKGDYNTKSVILYIYNLNFVDGFGSYKGKASAAAFIVFAMIMVISIIQMKVSKKGDAYE